MPAYKTRNAPRATAARASASSALSAPSSTRPCIRPTPSSLLILRPCPPALPHCRRLLCCAAQSVGVRRRRHGRVDGGGSASATTATAARRRRKHRVQARSFSSGCHLPPPFPPCRGAARQKAPVLWPAAAAALVVMGAHLRQRPAPTATVAAQGWVSNTGTRLCKAFAYTHHASSRPTQIYLG